MSACLIRHAQGRAQPGVTIYITSGDCLGPHSTRRRLYDRLLQNDSSRTRHKCAVTAAALYLGDTIAARRTDAARAQFVDIKLQAIGGTHKTIDMALVERDGTAWTASVAAGPDWTTVRVPIDQLHIARSIHIPSPFPGLWDYWRESSALRGTAGDRLQAENIDRLQLTVYPNSGDHAGDDARGAQVESIRLLFGTAP